MIDSWVKFMRLPAEERRVLVQALLLLPLTALALRLLSFNRCRAILASLSTVGVRLPDDSQANLPQALAVSRLVMLAARRGPYRANCLRRSLVLWWLLRRRGIASQLRIGARKEEGRFEAHAWVEYMGRVLNDSADVNQRFAPFDGVVPPLEVEPR